MKQKNLFIPALLASALLAPLALQAGAGHGMGMGMGMGSDDSRMDMMPGSHGAMTKGHAGHAHTAWLPAPQPYAGMTWSGWDDAAAAARGKPIYEQKCAYCHGTSGKGDGPAAASLAHKPADLTNNFHSAPGKGDDYLFWRVSEGGQAAPFRSQQSSMPPFKNSLSEGERWDVLTYVHQRFHGGFTQHSQGHPAADDHHHAGETNPEHHQH